MITSASIRLFLPLLFAALISAAPVIAQEGDEYDFSDIPVEEDELPYIGVGAGYAIHAALVNWDELTALADRFGYDVNNEDEKFSGPLLIHGGGGWTAIGIIPNVRIGVFGGGGSAEVSRSLDIGGTRYKRTMRFYSGYTAAQVDYAIPAFSRFTIAPGVMIGGGSNVLTLAQARETKVAFADLYDTSAFAGGSGNPNRQVAITNGHIFLFPMVNFEYALTQFIMIRVGGGYAMGIGDTWLDPQSIDVTDVPKIKADGLRLQAGVFLGLFQQ